MRRAPARTHSSHRSYRSRSYRYSYGYRSYGFNYGSYYGNGAAYAPVTGIKFHTELISKADKEMVGRGIVNVDGSEQGIVDRYDGWHNMAIQLAPGCHDVEVELEDGRVFQTAVLVQPGQLLRVYLRFPAAGSEKK